MIRKLMCWLGWHEYQNTILCMVWNVRTAEYEPHFADKCKHCGKVKK